MKTQIELLYEAYQNVYLSEEDLYFQEVAEFLLDEGFTEDEIYALTEEEDFLDILEVIEEAKKRTKTQIRQMGLSGRRTRKMGAEPRQMRGGQAVSASGKRLTGATKKSAESDIEAIRKARAERRQGTDKLSSKQAGSYHIRQRLKNMEKDIDREQSQKKAAEKPSQSLVGRLKSAYAAGMERHKQATEKAGKIAKGVAVAAATEHGARIKKASASKTPEQAERTRKAARRLGVMKGSKAMKEDYFDIVADYLLENFEFDSTEHLYSVMASLDEELIDEIIEEVGGSYL
jgi:hypothetical protein